MIMPEFDRCFDNIMWYVSEFDEIHLDQCHHIDNKCVKRYIKVFDIHNLRYVKIIVCNEYLRLLYASMCESSKHPIEGYHLIKSFIQDHVKIYSYTKDRYSPRAMPYFAAVPCCESPKIYHSLSITDYAKILYRHNDNNVNYIEACTSFIGYTGIFLQNHNLKKNKHIADAYRDLKNSKGYWAESDFLSAINDLLISILNHKLK